MANIFKYVKNLATIHDAAVDANAVENEKVGKYIPDQFSSAATANTLSSIAKASNCVRQIKIIAGKFFFLGVAAGGTYLAMKKNKPVAISDRKCKKIIKPSHNLTIANKLNNKFKYHEVKGKKQIKESELEQKTLVDTVKEQNISVRKELNLVLYAGQIKVQV